MATPSRRVQASRRNGRLGGIATAQKSTPEFLEQRAAKAGAATRDLYGNDYYRFLNSRRKGKRETPQSQQRDVIKEILPTAVTSTSSKELMAAAAKSLGSLSV